MYNNDEQEFVGIVTRKEVLKRVNYMVHELNRKYELVENNKKVTPFWSDPK